ncbi:alpha/beta hydrolase family protein [Thiocapsa rosea]|uniref:Alpha/beta hydrolase family protein n=1 Tax=Thiocapsa rosea TaxID=69360 RepID=A0A495VBR4_9GAMM|nr:alpha/beta fold hydrolase [Thiocapsa rosea]RKT46230.1 alpha/beta hydrolase family protein [Thiocapsa rosea]
MFSTDPFFDEQAMRTLVHTQFGGADFGECMVTMQGVPPGDAAAWHREWLATADRVAVIGDACAAAGHRLSAREAYLRASNYYRTSYIPLFGAPPAPALVHAFERESATFAAFAERATPPLEAVEIPYEGTTLPGYFCRASHVRGRGRTLIVTNGYDSTVHELYFAFAVAANRRGYHCLLFDGPGQGRVLIKQGLPMRPDWERVVRAVVDYAITRPEIDPARLALAGWSFGGYLALRAAGGESRLAACVADPGLMELLGPMKKMLADLPVEALEDPRHADPALFAPYMERIEATPALRWKIVQRAFWVHGIDSLAEYLEIARLYSNRQAVRSIRCPVFLAWEENDALAASAEEVYAALESPKMLARFLAAEGAGDHCAMMGRSLFHQRMFDWLDGVLADDAAAPRVAT